ncbi:Photosystem II 10 kDa polypeptide, chloroplastic-like protein [Drosera capensis]
MTEKQKWLLALYEGQWSWSVTESRDKGWTQLPCEPMASPLWVLSGSREPPLRGGVTPLKVVASGGKKINTNKPYGINGDMNFENGVDASGRKPRFVLFASDSLLLRELHIDVDSLRILQGKGVYQFVDKYGANVDGYSPIYNEDDWSPSGDVYVGFINYLSLGCFFG